ncbi:hypothetical protein O181_121924 [Austropuccinia psidii MF-1]|uniref:Chromo domain-containing protein n=1 Tax=Austropuccinia psidii MF-1 TaxID=1389203 RepID=A0A9Q3KJJ8_9BASI|nr:hypothetical protein [Austropuccinia psidii MF-1]
MLILTSKNIKETRTTKKLSERWFGSFSNFEYSHYSCIPPQCTSIHPVFHISLLEPVKKSTIPIWHQEHTPPIIIEEEEEFEVSKILDPNIKGGKVFYLVEWKEFSQYPERSTW